MLRLSNLTLPLGHAPEALCDAVLTRLAIPDADLHSLTVVRRAHDARKKSAVLMVYSVDVALADEAAVPPRILEEGDPDGL